MEERRYSLREAQEILGISERTIHRWIKSGKLKSYKPGRDHQIPEGAIRKVIEESEVYPKVQPSLPLDSVAGDELLERALDAARQDLRRQTQAFNRTNASQGVPQHMTGFAEDEVRRELVAAGFPDEHFEDFLWPLVQKALVAEELENLLSTPLVFDAFKAAADEGGAAPDPWQAIMEQALSFERPRSPAHSKGSTA